MVSLHPSAVILLRLSEVYPMGTEVAWAYIIKGQAQYFCNGSPMLRRPCVHLDNTQLHIVQRRHKRGRGFQRIRSTFHWARMTRLWPDS